jgi:hypothetical protein
MRRSCSLPFLAALFVVAISGSSADEPAAGRRRRQAMEFHLRAQERTGLLVPMYIYPSNIHTNPAYNRLIDLKRRYETIPMWVIVNPASGPGMQADENYSKAIDRLRGAGCVVLGYVTTSYAKRPEADVRTDVDRWLKMYPRIHGVFFDEMVYEDTQAAVRYQAALNQYAHDAGCWPTVANPGADVPGRYFTDEAADVFVVHEGDSWPTEMRLKGDFLGGYADHPPFTRGVLVYSQAKLDRARVRDLRKYARWVYVTEAEFRPNDSRAAMPWGRLSKHLEDLCDVLAEK